MTCDERQDLLLLYAGDLLDPAEREALREHLDSGCPACAGALAEARATLGQMAAAIEPVEPPVSAIDALMSRIDVNDAGATPRGPLPIRRGHPLLASLLAAAAAIAVTSGIWFYATRDARSFWRSTDLASVSLAGDTQPAARGTVLWDRDQREWRVRVSDLRPTAAGREYELWFIPADGVPIPSRTFRVGRGGVTTFVVNVPPEVGDAATAAISDEPIGGSTSPTGQIHLAGKFD